LAPETLRVIVRACIFCGPNLHGRIFMSQTLQYKGYDGSVEYSAEDRLLHGSLLRIRDGVVYEGSGVDSLESNFRAAVNEYLAFCAEEGKKPERPII
jgi:predicted HicB family RNase H-like nuclease